MTLTIYVIGFLVTLLCVTIYIKKTDQDGRVTAQDLLWCLIFASLWWAIFPMIIFWELLKLVAKILSK